MIKAVKNWLSKPYPLFQKNSVKTGMIIGVGLFTYAFLTLYKPFGINEITENFHLIVAGYSLLVSVGLSISYVLAPLVLPKLFQPEEWKVKNEILFLLVTFINITVITFLYHTKAVGNFVPQYSFSEYLKITFLIGIIPTIILIFFIESSLNKKHQKEAENVNLTDSKAPINHKNISISSNNLKEQDLVISTKDFLFAKSENNYIEVYFTNESKLEKKLIRTSMKKVEESLNDTEMFMRCHRSYLVNKAQIKKVKGNARSLNIYLRNYETSIPVSRAFPREQLS